MSLLPLLANLSLNVLRFIPDETDSSVVVYC